MLKIVVPLASGIRLDERKPGLPVHLAEIGGRPLIELVVHDLTPSEAHLFVFVVLEDDLRRWALDDVLRLVAPGCQTIVLKRPTAGELCSVLLALGNLDPGSEILVAGAARPLGAPIDEFLAHARKPGTDGCIATFRNTHPRWDYVRDEGDGVVQIAMRRPITDKACAGVNWFRNERDLRDAAERQIAKLAGAVTEFDVNPVFGELVLMGRRVTTWTGNPVADPRSGPFGSLGLMRHPRGHFSGKSDS